MCSLGKRVCLKAPQVQILSLPPVNHCTHPMINNKGCVFFFLQECFGMAIPFNDDSILTENEITCAKSNAESDYYKQQREKSLSYGISKSRDISELIKFVEDPKQTIKDYIEMLEAKYKILTNAIKYKKMMEKLENKFTQEIMSLPEYK